MDSKSIPKNINTSNADYMEHNYVYLTYEKIAQHFSDTRFKIWNAPYEFISSLPAGSHVVEVGCGNGKNMIVRDDLHFDGCDLSKEFVKICQEKKLNVIEANNLNIPYKDNTYDFTLSVAVIHHLFTKENRLQAIKELIRITKPEGKIFIEVWAFEQGEKSKFNFKEHDLLVPFKDKVTREVLGERFYHMFTENELEELVQQIPNVEIIKKFYEKGNWGIIIKKL